LPPHLELCANLVWAAPVLGALITPLTSRYGGKARDLTAVASCLASAVSASLLVQPLIEGALPLALRWEWVNLPLLGEVSFGVLLDPLSVAMANLVAWLSVAIFIYSIGYMKGEPELTRYWVLMQLFVGSMELLVLSENVVQLLVGWEGVGVCSYALIGYWYHDREEDYLTRWVGEAPEAYPPSYCGLKAFLVTRVGDALMIAGALLLALATGTLSFAELPTKCAGRSSPLLLPAFLLLFLGAASKSAQLPFMEWLPDAMAGPSSVSALIHSATMVKAGVYLTARLILISASWPSAPLLDTFFSYVMWTGVVTALVSAAEAAVSTELKKTLAYSTISQIGYMMAALGTARLNPHLAVLSATLHLLSHALFKAPLFLSAGIVIHSAGSRFYRHYRGLGRRLRLTMVATLLASMSLMGVPPFLGFWSKEAVLSTLLEASTLAFILALTTVSLTAFYSIRIVYLAFLRDHHQPLSEYGVEPREAEHLMLVPTLILAATGLPLGLAFPIVHTSDLTREVAPLSLIALAVGSVPALLMYARGCDLAPRSKGLRALRGLLLRRLYINAFYELLASSLLRLSARAGELERKIGLAEALLPPSVSRLADAVRRMHTGVLALNIVLWLAGGLAILVLLALLAP